jgi:hypothetical protein
MSFFLFKFIQIYNYHIKMEMNSDDSHVLKREYDSYILLFITPIAASRQ